MTEQLLIVEDDRELNRGLCSALKAPGRNVVSCLNLREAREQLLCGGILAVILDVNLPDGSGISLLREIKEKDSELPVLLLTANDLDSDIVDGLEQGAGDYISKKSCADFIVSSTDYFRFERQAEEYIPEEVIGQLSAYTEENLSGSGYQTAGFVPAVRMEEERMRRFLGRQHPEDEIDIMLGHMEKKDGLVTENAQMEGLDTALLKKVRVLEGDLSPLYDPDTRAVAIDVDVDDYGNPIGLEHYPQVGEKVLVDYRTEGYYIDTRTGEPADYASVPEEYLELKLEEVRSVEYTVCALVAVPYPMGYRYSMRDRLPLVLHADAMRKDSGQELKRLFYLFDTPDAEKEAAAESCLAELTADDVSPLMYESRAKVRADFKQFQSMFAVMGGTLCAIIGIVGILNFFNAVMTGILSRQKEFAMLQAVGMTGRQLKAMLIWEGMFYTVGSGLIALLLTLLLGPLSGKLMGGLFWFYESRFTVVPALCALPVFALLGWLIPEVLYRRLSGPSIVERLREL